MEEKSKDKKEECPSADQKPRGRQRIIEAKKKLGEEIARTGKSAKRISKKPK